MPFDQCLNLRHLVFKSKAFGALIVGITEYMYCYSIAIVQLSHCDYVISQLSMVNPLLIVNHINSNYIYISNTLACTV